MTDLHNFCKQVKIGEDDQKALAALGITDIDALKAHKHSIYPQRLEGVSARTQRLFSALITYLERYNHFDFQSFKIHMVIIKAELDDLRGKYDKNRKKGIDNETSFALERQGFDPSTDEITDDVEEKLDKEEDNLTYSGPDEVFFNGKCYKKGHCYHFSEKDGEVVVAIRALVVKEGTSPQAVTSLVVPVSQTFFGDGKETLYGSKYCQIRDRQRFVLLSELRDTVSEPEPKEMPILCYNPQKTGARRSFGYFFDESQVTRVGFRGPPKVIKFFCGSGGMYLGYKKHGFETLKAIDKDEIALQTFRHNNPGDAHAVEWVDVNEYLVAYKRRGVETPEVLHASSPCQGFSKANRNGGKNDAQNNELALSFTKGLRKTRALVGIFENVDGIWSEKGMPYLKRMLSELEEMRYQFRTMVLRACNYGDPQPRPRFIVFASREFVPLPLPPVPTDVDPRILRGVQEVVRPADYYSDKSPWVSTSDVLDIFTMVPTDTFPNMSDRRKVRVAGADVSQLHPDRLSSAILASGPAVLHYKPEAEGRPQNISVRDAAALQSYPNDYKFFGTLQQMYKQVGNAVPCGLASALASAAAQVLRFVYREELSKEGNGTPAAATMDLDDDRYEDEEKPDDGDAVTSSSPTANGGGEEDLLERDEAASEAMMET